MANKQYIGVIKLNKHCPAWHDDVNDIHLTRTHRTFKCVLSDYNLTPILKGIKAGYIEVTTAYEMGMIDSDDGVRMPQYACTCMCTKIADGVEGDYGSDIDYQSALEWKPEVAKVPTAKPRMIISGPTQVKEGEFIDVKIHLNKLDPIVDEDGNEQINAVLINVVGSAGLEVAPTELIFTSDDFDVDQLVVVGGVTVGSNSVDFSGEGVVSAKHNVKVTSDVVVPDPGPSNPSVPAPQGKMFFGLCSIDDVVAPEDLNCVDLGTGIEYIKAGFQDIKEIKNFSLGEDGSFMGNFIFVRPVNVNMALRVYNPLGDLRTEYPPKTYMIDGIEYIVEYVDCLGGTIGMTGECTFK